MINKYEIYFTKPAIQDLYYIKHYLEGYSSNLFAYFYKILIHKLELIENYPIIYEILPLKTSIKYRRFFVKQYAVIYEIDDENHLVIINRLYHYKENYLHM